MSRPAMSRRLNPHAPVFVPQSFVPSTHATKFSFVGADLNRPFNSIDEGNEHHRVLEVLPDEVGRGLLHMELLSFSIIAAP